MKLKIKIYSFEKKNFKNWNFLKLNRNQCYNSLCFYLKVKTLNFFLKIKLSFKKPRKTKYLFIDSLTKNLLFLFSEDDDYDCINVRGEEINVPILIIAIISNKSFSLKKLYKRYLEIYIKLAKPKYLLTLNDSTPHFWTLNNYRW